jgi:DNA-binding CsgD family transcriptional regulator
LIRVSILADSRSQEQAIAELLAEDCRIEVVDPHLAGSADVVIVLGKGRGDLLPEAGVIFLTDAEPGRFEAPGGAWLPMNVSASELVAAVLAVAQGFTVLLPAQARLLPGRRGNVSRQDALIEPLTNRELQVLRMLSDGLGNKEIAVQLGISEHTAKFHVAQILGKLGAGSRTEAVTVAIRRGLIPI